MTMFKTIGARKIEARFKPVAGLAHSSIDQKIAALVKAGVKKTVAKQVAGKMKSWSAASFYKATVSLADGHGTKLGVKSRGNKDGHLTTREQSRVFAKNTLALKNPSSQAVKTENPANPKPTPSAAEKEKNAKAIEQRDALNKLVRDIRDKNTPDSNIPQSPFSKLRSPYETQPKDPGITFRPYSATKAQAQTVNTPKAQTDALEILLNKQPSILDTIFNNTPDGKPDWLK